MKRPLRLAIAAMALWAWAVSGCGNRPLHKVPPVGADASTDRNAGVPDVAGASDVDERPAPCGADGQLCCAQGCNPGLACDQAPGATADVCTSRCGLTYQSCCHQGACETGTSCSTKDETGTCQPCGLPGLICCRGDCWIGVCEVSDAPRHCVECGRKGQACCGGLYSIDPPCTDGSACDRAPDQVRGTCSGACGAEGATCCRSGGCRDRLGCTTDDDTGLCRRCGGRGEPCCGGKQCRDGAQCVPSGLPEGVCK